MKVIGYIRVSTTEQEDSGLGLEAQEEKIRSYCGLYDLELVGICKDASSGKSLNRDGLSEALKKMQQGLAEGLICAKLDRLTRSVRDLGTLIEDYFKDYSLFVVAEHIDTRSAAGRFVANLLGSVAQWERETIGERTKEALEAKRRKGEKLGGDVQFGYDLADGGILVENGHEMGVIRYIKALRDKGYGYKKIADALNDAGYTTKQGKTWSNVTVGRVVKRLEDGAYGQTL